MSEDGHVWLVRAGGHGQDEEVALTQGLAVIGFTEILDLRGFASPEQLVSALIDMDPEHMKKRAETQARQLWAFREGIVTGDIAVLPLKTRKGQIALGRVTGEYEYRRVGEEMRHTRKVDWVRPDVSRTAFGQDVLYSLGAFLTVCRIRRNSAETRVLAVLNGQPDPGFKETTPGHLKTTIADDTQAGVSFDITQAAHDEIAAYVRDRFPSHDLARLVEAVLVADGFETHLSTPGPDGGADILAARGPLGLDAPTLCVQVKATEAAADVNVFRALQGTMSSFGAQQGLLVCWGGFTVPCKAEARQQTFKIRLWDQSDLLQAIYRCYERLPEEIQAELPLKRVWALVREANGSEG